jgi:hypothetical protein
LPLSPVANANETAQVAKRDGDAVAIAKADYYAEIAKDAIVLVYM